MIGNAPAVHPSLDESAASATRGQPVGTIPFRFACHRCGNCCSGGTGYVWLEEGEIERLAAQIGSSAGSFARRFVLTVRDPDSGSARLSLREGPDGRCALLLGHNTCSVYAARPEHCRTFPYWPGVLAGGAAFEAARATCPGIAVEVEAATRTRAFARLQAFYAALEPRAELDECCLDRADGERTFVTALEADYASSERPRSHGGCRLGDRRPLSCRIDRGAEEKLRELRTIERETGYPAAYGELRAMLDARGSALAEVPS